MENIYLRQNIYTQNNIPVFSEVNEYIESYSQISAFHLASLQKNGENPFIEESLWVEMEKSTIELIQKYSKEGQKILDVGVGLGRLLSHFPKLERYGMDITFDYLNIAKSHNIEVCFSLVEDMPYKEESFNVIACTDILEHVIDLNFCCKKILSVLKKGGYLIVRVPYQEDLSWYISPECPYKYSHLRTFDEYSLRLLFERILGQRVIDVRKSAYINYPNRVKLSPKIPKRDKFMRMANSFANKIKPIYPNLYNEIIKMLYNPVEINLVVQKVI
jgi:ubiquinone/menaquinone biosynthesis C-methylase UbiE